MKRGVPVGVVLTIVFCSFLITLGFPRDSFAADRSAVENFVTRFYTLCLDREPDSAGLDGWVSALLDGSQTGSDVAYGFVFSDEFINKNTTDEYYLTVLYEAFFNRNPDQGGWDGWIAELNSGTSRADVLNGFIFAVEFAELCSDYGILAFKPTPGPKKLVEDFVTRFYQLCLDRNPDTIGLEGWTNNLLNQIQTGADVANGFINSSEFIAKSTTNSQYLEILYKAFFGRDPDQGGWDIWLPELNAGKNRGEVLSGFIYSQEFTNLCDKYGIKAYDSVPPPPPAYNNETLKGAWFIISSANAHPYFIGDGSGAIIEHAFFNTGAVPGSYQVESDGSYDLTINTLYGTLSFSGTLTSSTEGTVIYDGGTGKIYKVTDRSVCQGTWSGTLSEVGNSNTYPITFSIDSNGTVTSFNGLEAPVSGKMFYESGYLVAFFKTGADENERYNQVRFNGMLSGNTITGTYEVDDGGDKADGSVALTRTVISHVSLSAPILKYPEDGELINQPPALSCESVNDATHYLMIAWLKGTDYERLWYSWDPMTTSVTHNHTEIGQTYNWMVKAFTGDVDIKSSNPKPEDFIISGSESAWSEIRSFTVMGVGCNDTGGGWLVIDGDFCTETINLNDYDACAAKDYLYGELEDIEIRSTYNGQPLGIAIETPLVLSSNTKFDIQNDNFEIELDGGIVQDCLGYSDEKAKSGSVNIETYTSTKLIGDFDITLNNGDSIKGNFNVNFHN